MILADVEYQVGQLLLRRCSAHAYRADQPGQDWRVDVQMPDGWAALQVGHDGPQASHRGDGVAESRDIAVVIGSEGEVEARAVTRQ